MKVAIEVTRQNDDGVDTEVVARFVREATDDIDGSTWHYISEDGGVAVPSPYRILSALHTIADGLGL